MRPACCVCRSAGGTGTRRAIPPPPTLRKHGIVEVRWPMRYRRFWDRHFCVWQGTRGWCQGIFWWTIFFAFFFVKHTSTPDRRRLLYHRQRFPSNRRWIPSNRLWLPFKCRPIVCRNAQLAPGWPEFLISKQKNVPCPTCTLHPLRVHAQAGPCVCTVTPCCCLLLDLGFACAKGIGGGGVGTRPWWLALLACGSAYWPLAFEPSAMTSRHPHYSGEGGGGAMGGCALRAGHRGPPTPNKTPPRASPNGGKGLRGPERGRGSASAHRPSDTGDAA